MCIYTYICVCTMEYHLAMKLNEIKSVVVMWIDLESVTQSEISQKEINKYCILMHIYIWNVEKWY